MAPSIGRADCAWLSAASYTLAAPSGLDWPIPLKETAMPDPKDNAKQTGDTHLPEVESDFEVQEGSPDAVGSEGTPSNRGKSSERGDEDRPGRGINRAGLVKDEESPDRGGAGS
jgi:hypothetical protein